MTRTERQQARTAYYKNLRASKDVGELCLLLRVHVEDIQERLHRVAIALITDDTARPEALALLGERRILEELLMALEGGKDESRRNATTNGGTSG